MLDASVIEMDWALNLIYENNFVEKDFKYHKTFGYRSSLLIIIKPHIVPVNNLLDRSSNSIEKAFFPNKIVDKVLILIAV